MWTLWRRLSFVVAWVGHRRARRTGSQRWASTRASHSRLPGVTALASGPVIGSTTHRAVWVSNSIIAMEPPSTAFPLTQPSPTRARPVPPALQSLRCCAFLRCCTSPPPASSPDARALLGTAAARCKRTATELLSSSEHLNKVAGYTLERLQTTPEPKPIDMALHMPAPPATLDPTVVARPN